MFKVSFQSTGNDMNEDLTHKNLHRINMNRKNNKGKQTYNNQ